MTELPTITPDSLLFDKTKPPQPPTPPDNTTKVNLNLSGNRTVMAVRIKPEIKQAFTVRTRQMGLSTCHVIEGLVTGWLMGVNNEIDKVYSSPTINLTLVRDVKRYRRYAVEEVSETVTEEVTPELVKEGIFRCGFAKCKRKAVATGYFRDKAYALCPVHVKQVGSDSLWRWKP